MILFFLISALFIVTIYATATSVNTKWYKIFVLVIVCFQIFSAWRHFKGYENVKSSWFIPTVSEDYKSFYLPKKSLEKSREISSLYDTCKHLCRLSYDASHYYHFFNKIKSCTGGSFDLQFANVSLLLMVAFLWGMYFWYHALVACNAPNHWIRNIFYAFVLLCPKVVMASSVPATTSFCIFAQGLFLWAVAAKASLFRIGVTLILCYLAQKHYYAGFVTCFSFLLIVTSYKKSFLVKILAFTFLFLTAYATVKSPFVKAKLSQAQYGHTLSGLGNSGIPNVDAGLIQRLGRITNAWFAPLYVNAKHFFYFPPKCSKLGWLYCIKTNIAFLYIFSMVFWNIIKRPLFLKNFYVFLLTLFLASWTVAGCSLGNYITANRHSEVFMPACILLLVLTWDRKEQK